MADLRSAHSKIFQHEKKHTAYGNQVSRLFCDILAIKYHREAKSLESHIALNNPAKIYVFSIYFMNLTAFFSQGHIQKKLNSNSIHLLCSLTGDQSLTYSV